VAWLWLALALAGCMPYQPQVLAFDVLQAGDAPAWSDPAPGVIAVAAADEAQTVAPYLPAEAVAALQGLDYAQEFGLLVLRGYHPTTVRDFAVQRVLWWGKVVTVQTQGGEVTGDAPASSPYQLLRVRKGPDWQPATTVRLLTPGDPENIVLVNHFIP
jgi:hypothetical protein